MQTKILKKFVKDFKIPIRIFQEPYFTYFMDLYKDYADTYKKLDWLLEAIEQCGGEDAFMEECCRVQNKVLRYFKQNPSFKEFNACDIAMFNVPNMGITSKDVFKTCNHGKYFMSIDLKQGNFQSLKYVNPEIVWCKDTWEDFISEFTNLDYIIHSKQIRQLIFGNINPRRQAKVERYIIQVILEGCINVGLFNLEDVRMISDDEIIVEIQDYEGCAKEVQEMYGQFFQIHVETYRLNSILNGEFYAKEFQDGKFELMCVPQKKFAQAYKYYMGYDLNEEDLLFMDDYDLCKYVQPLYHGRGVN